MEVNATADWLNYGVTVAYNKPNDLEFRNKLAITSTASINTPASRLRARSSVQILGGFIIFCLLRKICG
jgi:hypothetical protein